MGERRAPALKSRPVPDINSKWLDLGPRGGTVRVLAVAEGYVMTRFHGCAPFIVPMQDWHRRFAPKPQTRPTGGKDG